MKKNDIVTVTITDISSDGAGIGKLDGFPIFVKDAIIGDVVDVQLIKLKKSYAFGRVARLIAQSEDRIEPPCKVSRPCGGCQLQQMKYERQLEFKENKVRNNLHRIGGISEVLLNKIFEPIVGMDDPWRYRNKAQYPVARNKEGKIIAGFYAGRTHSVIACDDCLIGQKHHKEILDSIINWMEDEHIEPYNEATGIGLVRHILIRDAFSTGQIMVVLVVNCDINRVNVSRWQGLVTQLAKVSVDITSIQLNENRDNTNVILGRKCRVLQGSETIEDSLMGLSFRISPQSFYQVNPVQTEKLYSTAVDFAELSGNEEVWDICCGIGTISSVVARRLSDKGGIGVVHGIEIVPEAIANAKDNAIRNGIKNVDFICAAAEDYMPEHRSEISADVIITDPPRKGMDERSLEVMVSMNPEKIVYVSCDSATLARDVKYLTEHGYTLRRVRPVDMFPHGVHVECVVLLSRA